MLDLGYFIAFTFKYCCVLIVISDIGGVVAEGSKAQLLREEINKKTKQIPESPIGQGKRKK